MKLSNKYTSVVKRFVPKNLNLHSYIGFSITGILLWLTFHKSGLTLEGLSLNRPSLLYFAIAEVLLVFSVWVYSIRAKLFWLSGDRKSNNIKSFDSLVVGNFYNCLLPGNLGEGMRAWHFSRKNKIPFLQALSSLFAEKWIVHSYLFCYL